MLTNSSLLMHLELANAQLEVYARHIRAGTYKLTTEDRLEIENVQRLLKYLDTFIQLDDDDIGDIPDNRSRLGVAPDERMTNEQMLATGSREPVKRRIGRPPGSKSKR